MLSSFSLKTNGAPLICGHRGDSLHAPENTVAALDAVAAAGGNSAEIDVILTADSEIVLLHDLAVDRTTDGSGIVADMTLAEVQALDAGSWFSATFEGHGIPTLAEALTAARRQDMALEIEIKEKRRLDGMLSALGSALADPASRERVMLISFDHRWLMEAKQTLPWLKTGGIVHERFGDPVAVARSASLDQLCIDFDVFDAGQARALHDAGITIRCHAFRPDRIEAADRAGLAWRDSLKQSLADGLIDILSGDDVGWLTALAHEAGAVRDGR